jgi:hypothetical protein
MITLKDYFSYLMIIYIFIFFFIGLRLLLRNLFGEKKKDEKVIVKNFLWSWGGLASITGIVFGPIYLFEIHKANINETAYVLLAALPIILSCLVILPWRFCGPVIIKHNNRWEIISYKFLFRPSQYFEINYDNFNFYYNEGRDFRSEKFNTFFFNIEIDSETVNQLYLKFVPEYLATNSNYRFQQRWQRGFQLYLILEIKKRFLDIWQRYRLDLDTYSISEEGLKEILKNVQSDCEKILSERYTINFVVHQIEVKRTQLNPDFIDLPVQGIF